MNRITIASIRLLLILLAAGMVFMQTVVLPMAAQQSAQVYPEVAYLATPFILLFGGVILAAEVVVVCVWILLTMVRRDSIFTPRAFVFVNVIIGAFGVISAILLGVDIFLTSVLHANPPAVAIGLAGGTISCAAIAALMLVMRGLLVKAVGMNAFIQEVV